jgi:hypothetical protein
MIIDRTTNKESSLNCVIIPGSESCLPTKIHPKEIRLVTLSGYNSETKPGDDEFEEWYNSFNGYAIYSWFDDVITRNKRQKRYRNNNSQMCEYYTEYSYNRLVDDPLRSMGSGCLCGMGCVNLRKRERVRNKIRKKNNLLVRIDNDIKSMHYDRYKGRMETKCF